MTSGRTPPSLQSLLGRAHEKKKGKPIAFVLAGHNGSGKSTFWYQRLAPVLKMPLINADRLTLSILPEPDKETKKLPAWAIELRDTDPRWQRLSQEAVKAMQDLVIEKKMPFAVETVFSHWKVLEDGTVQSKIDVIKNLQAAGYFVVLLFVGLASVELSVFRVRARKELGGHDVPLDKLQERFPRTQLAIANAALVADMAIMFDNSRSLTESFSLGRAQAKDKVLFDCRDPEYKVPEELRTVAQLWLTKVAGNLPPLQS